MDKKERKARKNPLNMWSNIPEIDDYGNKITSRSHLWHTQQTKKDPYYNMLSRMKHCPFSHLPLDKGTKENHPDHISKGGHCIYCGRLE